MLSKDAANYIKIGLLAILVAGLITLIVLSTLSVLKSSEDIKKVEDYLSEKIKSQKLCKTKENLKDASRCLTPHVFEILGKQNALDLVSGKYETTEKESSILGAYEAACILKEC